MSHSERAYCLARHYEALKSQGRRNDLLDEIEMLLNPHESRENPTSSEVQTKLRSDTKIGQEYGLSRDKVAKYIRISKLIEPLIGKVDTGEIPFLAAYDLSFIPASNEPSGRACTASWRMPRGSNTKVSEGHFLLCSVASLIAVEKRKTQIQPPRHT